MGRHDHGNALATFVVVLAGLLWLLPHLCHAFAATLNAL